MSPPSLLSHRLTAQHRKTEDVEIFLEFPCFLYDPTNVGNLISGSSAFSKPSLYIWKFSVHVLLEASLKDFERNFLACEMRAVLW